MYLSSKLPSCPGIYKITSPSGKIYIGQSENVKYRIRKHIYESKTSNLPIHNAINKYGLDNLDIECIFKCDEKFSKETVKVLNDMEKYYIKFYNSFYSGYNLTKGGDSTIQNEETKRKIGTENSNPSIETRNKIRESLLKSTRFSAESIMRIEKAKTKRVASVNCDGNIIEEFNSISEAAKSVGVSCSNISAHIAGKSKTSCGFVWIML